MYLKDVTTRNGETIGIVAFETRDDRENALKQLHGQRLNSATVYVYEVSSVMWQYNFVYDGIISF